MMQLGRRPSKSKNTSCLKKSEERDVQGLPRTPPFWSVWTEAQAAVNTHLDKKQDASQSELSGSPCGLSATLLSL